MYILDLTNCESVRDVIVAIESDLNAHKQLCHPFALRKPVETTKKPWYKWLFNWG